jgi:hypothetical protein
MRKTSPGAALALIKFAPAALFAQKFQEAMNTDRQRALRFAPEAEEAGKKYPEAVARRGQT